MPTSVVKGVPSSGNGTGGAAPGQSETREQILDAARHRFAELGYDGATVRGIAADAGVNAALLHHFFGSKQQLSAAAMNLPVNPAELVPSILAGPRDGVGERLVRAFPAIWATPEGRTPFLAMLRAAATNEQAAVMMRQFVEHTVPAEVAPALDVPRIRVTGIAAQLVGADVPLGRVADPAEIAGRIAPSQAASASGVALPRYVIKLPPLAESGDEELVELLSPGRAVLPRPGTRRSRAGHPARHGCADSSRWLSPPSPC